MPSWYQFIYQMLSCGLFLYNMPSVIYPHIICLRVVYPYNMFSCSLSKYHMPSVVYPHIHLL